ncbi:MAG: type II toxin-antitoxin system HicB family antitoxin [Thermosynechococcaceae cyanobacterium]
MRKPQAGQGPLLHQYTIILRPESNGTFVAQVPAIPGCHAWGETPTAAQAELVNVFTMIYEEHQEEGKSLPENIELVFADASDS